MKLRDRTRAPEWGDMIHLLALCMFASPMLVGGSGVPGTVGTVEAGGNLPRAIEAVCLDSGRAYVMQSMRSSIQAAPVSKLFNRVPQEAGEVAEERHDPKTWEARWIDAAEWLREVRKDERGNLDWESIYREAKYAQSMPASRLRQPGSNLPEGSWQYIGPRNVEVPYRQYFGNGPISGRVNAVAFSTDPGTSQQVIYIATPYGGVRKSTDGGVNWLPKSNGPLWTQLHTSCLAVDPNDANTLYVGTGDYQGSFGGGGIGNGYGMGLMRSTDGGETWDAQFNADSIAAMGTNIAVAKVVVVPASGPRKKTIIATTGRGQSSGSGTIWIYQFGSDAGDNQWRRVLVPFGDWGGLAMSIPDGSGVRRVYAGMAGANPQIWYTEDNGLNWTQCTTPATPSAAGSNFDLACSSYLPNTVFCLLADVPSGNVYRSSNKGSSWTAFGSTIPATLGTSTVYNWSQSTYNWHITVAGWNDGQPRDAVYVGLIDLVCARYGTDSWTSIGRTYYTDSYIHNDQHCMAVNPNNGNEVWAGNDGGLYKIVHNRSANTWVYTSYNSGLDNTQFYSIASHVKSYGEFRVFGGTQDNGTPRNLTTATNFDDWTSAPSGGDGGHSRHDPIGLANRYATVNNLGIWRSTDNGNSWTDITFRTGSGASLVQWKGQPTMFIAPIAVNEAGTAGVYGGTDRVWYNAGSSWAERARRPELASNEALSAMKATNAGTGTRLYFATNLGKFFMSNDRGLSATRIGAGSLPTRVVTSIAYDTTNHNRVLVSFGTLGARNLWLCSNVSAASPTWVDVSGPASGDTNLRLPNAPINEVIVDPDDPTNTWYVANDVGVFMTVDAGATYTNLGTSHGLPPIQVNGLAFNPETRHLHAGTFGMGAWRIQVPITTGSISFAPSSVSAGDLSVGTVTMSTPAPYDGWKLTLGSTSPYVTLPPTVTIPEGQTSANFLVGTSEPPGTGADAIVTARLGSRTYSGTLGIRGSLLGGLVLDRTEAFGGTEGSIGTLTLKSGVVAPNGGLQVDVTSSHPAHAWVSPVATIQSGYNYTQISVNTLVVSTFQMVTITCTYDGQSVSDTLYVKPNRPKTFTVDRATALGGTDTVTGTITIDAAAVSGGQVVSLTTNYPQAITLPGSSTVSYGYDYTQVTIPTKVVATQYAVTVTATCNGGSKTVGFTVLPNRPKTLALDRTVALGGTEDINATVTLDGAATNGGQVVNLSVSTTTPCSVPPTATVSVGYDYTTFTVTTKVISVDKLVTLSASCNGGTKTINFLVLANRPNSLVLDRESALGGTDPAYGTVTLIGAATNGGQVVNLSSSNTAAAVVPSSITVTAGYTYGIFEVATSTVSAEVTVTLTAACNGGSATDTLIVQPNRPTSLTFDATALLGGTDGATGTIRLVGPAKNGGQTVALTRSNTSIVVPTSVVVSTGYDYTTFSLSTVVVNSDRTATVTASCNGGTTTGSVTVLANYVIDLILNQYTAVGGHEAPSGTVSLRGAAGNGGQVVEFSSSSPSKAYVSGPVTVSAGYSYATFVVSTNAVTAPTNVTITATANGGSQAVVLRVVPPLLTDFTLTPSSTLGGVTIVGSMTLSHPAPAGLTASITKTSANVNPPPAVGFATGSTTKSFNIPTTAVTAWQSSLVRATIGDVTIAKTLILTPGGLLSLTCNPTSVIGGDPSTGTVTMTGTAPSGGAVVNLTSTAGATVPPTVTIPAGLNSRTFTITSLVTASTKTVTITATKDGTSKSATLTVTPGGLLSLTLNPATVTGGNPSQGTVTLSGPAPAGGRVISLRSGNGYASVPASVTVPQGATSATFTVNSIAVTVQRTSTIYGTLNLSSKSAVLTINP